MTDHPVLAAVAHTGMRLGLPRVRSFLSFLGDPHLRYPVVHVAGTNGKGSVCRFVGAMLDAQGLRVGVTTSPHLQQVNERIRVGAAPISDDDLDRLLWRIEAPMRAWARAEGLDGDGLPLTWFELSVAAAFQHFADTAVDVAVVEVGMGGRLDATNVVAPVVTSIVTVGLDHTEQLGPDHASIAAEKAGILKPGVPAVLGPLNPAALQVVRVVARDRGAPIDAYGEAYTVSGGDAGFTYRAEGVEREGLRVGLAGHHQVSNAGVAVRIVDRLPPSLRPSESAIRAGLLVARNRGRLEWLAPDLLVDGAHNPDGAGVLASYLASLPRDRRRTLLLGAGGEKDVRGVAAALAPHVDRVYTTSCAHPKARSPGDVATQLEGMPVPVSPVGPIEEALPVARSNGDLVIVAGSLFLVGAVRDLVGAP